MADSNGPNTDSSGAQARTATSRIPAWLQRVGSRLKDIVRPVPQPLPVKAESARRASAAMSEQAKAERERQTETGQRASAPPMSVDGLPPSEQKQRALRAEMRARLTALEEKTPAHSPVKSKAKPANVHEALGPREVDNLLAGNLHPSKLKTVFSKLEKAGLGHLAEAGSRPPMPAIPGRNPSVSTTAPRSTVSSKGSEISHVSAASSTTSVGSSGSTPAGTNEVRSRDTVPTSREGVARAVTGERSRMDERPRGRGR